jgi:GNAT superfamily N-acetyltransferase
MVRRPAGPTIRPASLADAPAVAALATALAQSYPVSRPAFDVAFDVAFDAVRADPDACLLVAVDAGTTVGYLLGCRHLTFYANGLIGVVEEIMVAETMRGRGVGRSLMDAFEHWARDGGCVLVTLATRRAAAFYRALGYDESAVHFRKPLVPQPGSR